MEIRYLNDTRRIVGCWLGACVRGKFMDSHQKRVGCSLKNLKSTWGMAHGSGGIVFLS